MNLEYVVTAENLTKQLKGFCLDIPQLQIPKGYATALIGENGAGKTTLLNILAGIRLDYKGDIKYFGQYTDKERESGDVKERIGYTGPNNYYLPQWNVRQIEEISELLFANFDVKEFRTWVENLAIFPDETAKNKKVSSYSDGMKMKLMLAGVVARQTDLLLLDEPASPLDPLMRDKLCQMIREYIADGNGEKTVFFSTHNISDMEYATDYAIIMEHGKIVESGFVEDLKEKYILVKGEKEAEPTVAPILYSLTTSPYGFEGICLAKDIDKLSGMDVHIETPSLFQISVAIMRANSKMK